MDIQYGEKLKEARVEKGLSLQEVSDELKINLNTLRRIEESKTGELPKAPFTRGFLKSYSSHVYVDSKIIIEAYDKTLDEPRASLKKGVLIEDDNTGTFFLVDFFREKIFPLVLLGSTLVGAMVIYSFLKQSPFENSSDIGTLETSAVEQVIKKEKTSEAEPIGEPLVEATGLIHVATVYGGEKAKKENVEAKDVKRNDVIRPLSFKNELVVEPLAKTRLYIKTNLDDSSVRATLIPDVKRTFKFDEAEIRFLDAGAVNVILNGKDLGALGGFGEEKKIKFPSLQEL